MLNFDINKFEICFFNIPNQVIFGAVTHPELKEPIILSLDITANENGLLHMELLNGNEKIIEPYKQTIKDKNLSEEQTHIWNSLAEMLSHKTIFMNKLTKEKLMHQEIDSMCVLYHELGHLVHSDELQNVDLAARNELIEKGMVSPDEYLADEYSYQKFGNKVCETLETQIEIARGLSDKALLIKEFKMRIKHLKEKYGT